MKKFLLTLLLTMALVIPANADTKTIIITPETMQTGSTSSKYVTTAFTFSAGDFTFKTNQVNPSNGQLRISTTGNGAFTISNTTAIPNIKSIAFTYTNNSTSTIGTWYAKTGNTEITSLATTSDIAGNKGSFTIPESTSASFFRISLTAKGSGALYFSKIEITYEETPAGPVEPGDVLVNGAAAPEEIEVAQGETITFTSDKATKLKFESDELGIIDEIEGSTYTHTADFTNAADGYFLTVTPCDNKGTAYAAHAATVMITRKAAPLCGEITFTPADGAVYAGNAVTIACENATEIKYTIDGGEELTYDAATGIEITAACTIVAWGLNGDGVEGDKATLNVTIKEADKYVQITSLNDIKLGEKYLFVGVTSDSEYYLPTPFTGTSGKFDIKATTPEGKFITIAPESNIFTFTILASTTAGQYLLYNEDTEKYLNCPAGSNTDVNYNFTSTSSTIAFQQDGSCCISSNNSTRALILSTGAKKFANYAKSNAGKNGYSYVLLYRLVTDEYYTDEAPAELHIHGSHYAGSWAASSQFDQTATGVFTFYGFLAYEEGEATPALVFSTAAKKKADDPNTEVTGIRPRKAAPAADYWNDIDGDVFMPETDGAAIGTHKLVRVSTADLAAGKASLNTFAAEHNKSYDLTVDFNGYSPVATLAEHDDSNVPTGVENIDAAETAEVEYFNLSGLRVANPENGIFIRRQGNKVTKVLVK